MPSPCLLCLDAAASAGLWPGLDARSPGLERLEVPGCSGCARHHRDHAAILLRLGQAAPSATFEHFSRALAAGLAWRERGELLASRRFEPWGGEPGSPPSPGGLPGLGLARAEHDFPVLGGAARARSVSRERMSLASLLREPRVLAPARDGICSFALLRRGALFLKIYRSQEAQAREARGYARASSNPGLAPFVCPWGLAALDADAEGEAGRPWGLALALPWLGPELGWRAWGKIARPGRLRAIEEALARLGRPGAGSRALAEAERAGVSWREASAMLNERTGELRLVDLAA